MFRHSGEYPCSFFFTEAGDTELMDSLREWFLTRQPEHIIRRLVNNEAETHKASHELIFTSKTDAMEFKLTFL